MPRQAPHERLFYYLFRLASLASIFSCCSWTLWTVVKIFERSSCLIWLSSGREFDTYMKNNISIINLKLKAFKNKLDDIVYKCNSQKRKLVTVRLISSFKQRLAFLFIFSSRSSCPCLKYRCWNSTGPSRSCFTMPVSMCITLRNPSVCIETEEKRHWR